MVGVVLSVVLAVSSNVYANPLSVDMLRNAEYPSGFAPEGVVRLENGEFHHRIARRGVVNVRMEDPVAIGTLADGTRAAAVVLETTTGGNATFHDLTLMVEEAGKVHWEATTPLGDRVTIEDVRLENGEIVVVMLEHGPDDPLCCPAARVEFRYVVEGSRLVTGFSELAN